MLLENIENYLLNCHDIVSVLLMIKVTNTLIFPLTDCLDGVIIVDDT